MLLPTTVIAATASANPRASQNIIGAPLAATSQTQSGVVRFAAIGDMGTGESERFLEVVNNQANWPVFVHCAGGRHRTGVMTAVYRMSVDGWDIEQAYREMKQYDFYTGMGHGCYKDYVYDYYRDLQAHPPRQRDARARNGN